MNLNTLNLSILGKNNIVCVSLVNATMRLNTIRELNVPNLMLKMLKNGGKNEATQTVF